MRLESSNYFTIIESSIFDLLIFLAVRLVLVLVREVETVGEKNGHGYHGSLTKVLEESISRHSETLLVLKRGYRILSDRYSER